MAMTTILTVLIFVAITIFFVARHMKKSGEGAGDGAGRDLCPRCRAPHVPGALRCSSCGVPFQAYEIVSAPIAAAEPDKAAGEDGGKLHAIVRADICVGCGTCVSVCPEPGAIQLRGKLAVVDRILCLGHGKCAEACPVGAIVITTGAAVHRVEVPLLDANFQTTVPGLYIVGELGGRGLIKNAVNEGRIAIEHIANATRASGLRGGAGARAGGQEGRTAGMPAGMAPDPASGRAGARSRRPGSSAPGGSAAPASSEHTAAADDIYDIAIVGSGPAGVSAGLEALRLGLNYVVLEQGSFADSIRKYPRHKVLLAEPVTMPLYGNLWIADASKESLLEKWEEILEETSLNVQTGARVTDVSREDDRFRVETDIGPFTARSVVLAMGRRGTPRKLGVPGEELQKVLYDIVEMEAFAGRRVLVVGGGDTAVESALGLANQQGAEVTLSYRGDGFKRVKERNLAKLEAAVAKGKLKVELMSEVKEIGPDSVVLVVGEQHRILPNDDVIVRVGGDPPYAFLQRAGVRIVRKDVPIPNADFASAS
jgi:thioredoxin reductase (NADPH)